MCSPSTGGSSALPSIGRAGWRSTRRGTRSSLRSPRLRGRCGRRRRRRRRCRGADPGADGPPHRHAAPRRGGLRRRRRPPGGADRGGRPRRSGARLGGDRGPRRASGLRDLGEHRLKDLARRERMYQLGDGEFPPLRSLQRTNLPVPATPFVGRERELAEAGALLERGAVADADRAGRHGEDAARRCSSPPRRRSGIRTASSGCRSRR